MKNEKVTHMNLGLVNRRMLRIGMIIALATSFVLLIAFFAQVKGSQTTLQLKETLPALAFALGIAFALIAGIYAYLCFSTLYDVVSRICGKPHLDYLHTDVFQVHEVYFYGGLDEDCDNWFCICKCDVYEFLGTVQSGRTGHGEPRFRMRHGRRRVMFCFPSGEAADNFINNPEVCGYWCNDGSGGLEQCDRPILANRNQVVPA